jgi:hypothetical protein
MRRGARGAADPRGASRAADARVASLFWAPTVSNWRCSGWRFSRIEKSFPKNWKNTPRCGHYIHEGQRLITGCGANDRRRRLFSTASTPTQAAALSPTAPLLLFRSTPRRGKSGTPGRRGCRCGKSQKTNNKSQKSSNALIEALFFGAFTGIGVVLRSLKRSENPGRRGIPLCPGVI